MEELGYTVLVSPVIAIEAIEAAWPAGTVDAVLATSSQAFRAMPSGWGPQPTVRRVMPLWLVGRRTMDAARERNFLGATHIFANAVGLAMDLKAGNLRGRTVYLAGHDRKPDIETALDVMEQNVELIEMYKAQACEALDPQTVRALAAESVDAALHFSRRSAELFQALVAAANVSPPRTNYCLSADTAAPLSGAGWTTRVSRDPTEDSLVAALAAAEPT